MNNFSVRVQQNTDTDVTGISVTLYQNETDFLEWKKIINSGIEEYTREKRRIAQSIIIAIEEYFTEMLQMIGTRVFDILGHIDYPVRVLKEKLNGDPSLKRWESLITPCLKALIDNGIALEFSTVLSRCWAETFGIEPWLLEKYKKLGGEMVTLGSDGHVPELTCFGIEKASRVLKDCGFDKTTVFVDRKPQFILI